MVTKEIILFIIFVLSVIKYPLLTALYIKSIFLSVSYSLFQENVGIFFLFYAYTVMKHKIGGRKWKH